MQMQGGSRGAVPEPAKLVLLNPHTRYPQAVSRVLLSGGGLLYHPLLRQPWIMKKLRHPLSSRKEANGAKSLSILADGVIVTSVNIYIYIRICIHVCKYSQGCDFHFNFRQPIKGSPTLGLPAS